MKTREVIKIKQTMTLEELHDFMQQHWDRESYNDFVIGRPGFGTFRDYIMLPATTHCTVCVYPGKGKVILAVMTNSQGQKAIASSMALGGYGRMSRIGETNGIAAQANGLYAAYLESLFAEAGMLSGNPKREKPVLGQLDPDSGKNAGNVLELVKIAPPESRWISILSLVFAIFSLILSFSGIPGLLMGILAIVTANSVLKKKGYHSLAYSGRFCGIVGVWMSGAFTFIIIVGYLLAVLYA